MRDLSSKPLSANAERLLTKIADDWIAEHDASESREALTFKTPAPPITKCDVAGDWQNQEPPPEPRMDSPKRRRYLERARACGADAPDVYIEWCAQDDEREVPALLSSNGALFGKRKATTSLREDRVRPTVHRERDKWEELSEDDDPIAVAFPDGGWQIEKAGATGNPVGRPARGIIDPDLLRDRLTPLLGEVTLERAIDIAGKRGRQTAEGAEDRKVLASALSGIDGFTNRGALADVLGCKRRTIDRLVKEARRQEVEKMDRDVIEDLEALKRGMVIQLDAVITKIDRLAAKYPNDKDVQLAAEQTRGRVLTLVA